jgi:hypothetical protein
MATKHRRTSATATLEKPAIITRKVEVRGELLTRLPLLLVGTMPLIVNCWSEKAKEQLRSQHTRKARGVREAKNPKADFEGAKYRSADGWEGAPAHGMKGALVEAARFVGGSREMNMTSLKSALYVEPDCQATNLLRIHSPAEPVMREDLVRVGRGMNRTVDLRYRPQYWPWFIRIAVQFPSAMFNEEQISDLIRAAGSFIGFCEWRPGSPESKTGSFGTFKIANDEEVINFEKTFRTQVA